jgi:pimeloyl-ACP methyl ester carboxylesterase
MSKPTFICVPGASHSPLIFDPVKSSLAYYGYEVTPITLPSVGGNPATYDFTEDVRAIRNLVAQYADSGRDVILVMHGYGGLPGAEALHGLGKAEREQRGLRGGVVRLVFIMSVCMPSFLSPLLRFAQSRLSVSSQN